jgi:hypothetical protein
MRFVLGRRSSLSSTCRLFATSSKTPSSTPKPSLSRWKLFAAFVRYTRIPVLVFSVYTVGYQQGIIDCTKTPLKLQQQLLDKVLVSIRASQKDIQIVNEGEINFMSSSSTQQVASVAQKIIASARGHVQEQLQAAIHQAMEELPSDATQSQLREALLANEQVQFWQAAQTRIQGENGEESWQYILIDSKLSNAFVMEMLPRKIFITTSMLKIAETANELAIVLGHEGQFHGSSYYASN